ncbi:MAG: insulinase family protein [Muribaculum sp.]|nr:insulinase family protein [Muribaculum sp.]
MNLKHLFASLLCAAAIPVAAQITEPGVTVGHLDNGLTYYILPTKNSGQRADFFLARNVGSINEADNQQGLAHFMEHLCFNGTKHFPGNSLISYLESVGVKFGKNLNASTNTDRTIFNISKVPTARQSTLDSCLLILRDWSGDVTMRDEDIDAERGVIKEEWRSRNSASNRMLQRAVGRIFPNSPYGCRLPIGKMEIVESFKPQVIRDFYADWYRPASSAVIVVGDIDALHTEQMIKDLFSDLPASPLLEYPAPNLVPNEQMQAVVETDPEQSVEMLSLYFKYPARTGLSLEEDVRASLIDDLVAHMLVNRMDNAELKDNAAASSIGVGNQKFLLASPLEALTVRARVTPGRSAEAFADIYTELRRARELGFTEDELSEASEGIISGLRHAEAKASLRSTTDLANRLVRVFLDGDRFDAPSVRLAEAQKQIKSITLNDIQGRLMELLQPSGRNFTTVLYAPAPSEGESVVSEEELASVFRNVNNLALEPFVPVKLQARLLAAEPVRGKVVKSKRLGKFDAEVLTLSNGIKVYMKPTKFHEDEIFVRGIGYGGFSQKYHPDQAANMKVLEDILPLCGFGEFSASDLRRWQHGRSLKVSTKVANMEESMELSSNREDLEDAFRLMYLKVSDIRPDKKAFDSWMAQKRAVLPKQFLNPIQVMGDSITSVVYSHQPLEGKLRAEWLDHVNLDDMMEIYRDRYADFSDFSFFVAGDYDRDRMIDLLERYVASLPVNGRVETPKEIGLRFVEGKDNKITFTCPMETPQSVVYQFRHMECPYTLENILMASAVGRVLKSKLLADIREDKGWTYSITGHGAVTKGINGQDPSQFMMPTYVKTSPEHASNVSNAIENTVAQMAEGKITEADLAPIREYFMKSIVDNREDNGYWLVAMRAFDKFGLDLDSGYEKAVAKLTPAKMSKFMKKYVTPADRLILTMLPE